LLLAGVLKFRLWDERSRRTFRTRRQFRQGRNLTQNVVLQTGGARLTNVDECLSKLPECTSWCITGELFQSCCICSVD